MKQYRITTDNIRYKDPDDCFLAEDDPVHEFLATQLLGGLGGDARVERIKNNQSIWLTSEKKNESK